MAYQYKRFLLPEYKEVNWHTLVMPILEWTIDNLIINDYQNNIIDVVNDNVYVGKVNSNNNWLIKKVEESIDNIYTITWASNVNNPSYNNIINAFNNKTSLLYASSYDNLIQ